MLDVNIKIEDIIISSIEQKDLIYLHEWFETQSQHTENIDDNSLSIKELNERYLEYYLSESEFFLKVTFENKLIGILKGRLEFKNPNEMWYWWFLLDHRFREKGIGKKIIKHSMNYFFSEYCIDNFYSVEIINNSRTIKFWKDNGFKVLRSSPDFYNINGKTTDILILQNIMK